MAGKNPRGHLVHLINMKTEAQITKLALDPGISGSNQFYFQAITYHHHFPKQPYGDTNSHTLGFIHSKCAAGVGSVAGARDPGKP